MVQQIQRLFNAPTQHCCQKRQAHGEVVGLRAEHCEHGGRGDVPEGDADEEHHHEEQAELGDEDSQEEGDVDRGKVQGGQGDEDEGGHGVLPNEDVEPPGLLGADHLEGPRQPAQADRQEDLGDGRNQISQVNILRRVTNL